MESPQINGGGHNHHHHHPHSSHPNHDHDTNNSDSQNYFHNLNSSTSNNTNHNHHHPSHNRTKSSHLHNFSISPSAKSGHNNIISTTSNHYRHHSLTSSSIINTSFTATTLATATSLVPGMTNNLNCKSMPISATNGTNHNNNSNKSSHLFVLPNSSQTTTISSYVDSLNLNNADSTSILFSNFINFKNDATINSNLLLQQTSSSPKWTLIKPQLMAIAICNFHKSLSRPTANHKSWNKHFLEFNLGDVLVITERFGPWYRGYHDQDSTFLGLIPANYVHVFGGKHHREEINDDCQYSKQKSNNYENDSMVDYYYALLDPLFLQVIRTIREWYSYLVGYFQTNTQTEKFLIVRNLIYELFELSTMLSKELAPSLWRRRSNQLLKINTDPKDPFAKLYLGEEDSSPGVTISEDHSVNQNSPFSSLFELNLEELYDRILSKLNQGNQHLNLDIMPSFTHGAFNNNDSHQLENNKSSLVSFQKYQSPQQNFVHLYRMFWAEEFSVAVRRRNKFKPFQSKEQCCKYLPFILDYYNQIQKRFQQKFKSNINRATSTTNIHRHSLSFQSHSNSPVHHFSKTGSSSSCSNNNVKKHRCHLLLSIREANFSNFSGNLSDNDQLQIDIYILRSHYNGSNTNNGKESSSNSASSSSNAANLVDSSPYDILTEKFCYRINASSHQTQPMFNHQSSVNRALFLDVLFKRSSSNGLNTNNHFASHHPSDSSNFNYHLVVQVWRFGKMLLNESRTKTILGGSGAGSLTAGSSVFHTITTGSISSAATSASLSSITSFVSGTSLFNSSNSSNMDKSTNSSSTPETSSVDSSEFGGTSFKRSLGFSVIPLYDIIRKHQEIKPNGELFDSDGLLISKILLGDESTLPSYPVKLYEGDLTMSVLETFLKHRPSSSSVISMPNLSSSSLSSSSSSPMSSKLSPLASTYQLSLSAKFINELVQNSVFIKNHNGSISSLNSVSMSLADYLLPIMTNPNLNISSTIGDNISTVSSSRSFLNCFVLVQKRHFSDLVLYTTCNHFRNDFYLTLESAEFEKGGKAIPKNIEVSVCLITDTGIQERAIRSGANDEAVTIYRSHIQYHQNSPKWFENIKVNVPLDQFETAHLRFLFCHCSSKERERKFLGFAFLPLADQNGACLSDGEHELAIYKCDSEKKLDDVFFYLNIPWKADNKSSNSNNSSNSSTISSSNIISASSQSLASQSNLINSRSSKEVFHIKTTLFSSKLTQNSDILLLLKWSSTPLEQVYEALQRINRVPEEMVKFLEDILDALFALFTTNANSSSQQTTGLIFRVLIDFFKTLNDSKFAPHRLTLETYIENQFSASLVYSGLTACVKKSIELVVTSFQCETGSISGVTKRELEFILRCMSVFDLILKIIIQSRILYTQASINGSNSMTVNIENNENESEPQSSENFRQELLSLFDSINQLLMVECRSSDDYLIIAIQEAVLSALPNAFEFLAKVFSPIEVVQIVKSIVNSNSKLSSNWSPTSSSIASLTPTNSNPSSSSRKTIINAKLSLLQQTIRYTYIWSRNEKARIELIDTFIRLLNISISESRHCLSIFRDLIVYLIEKTTFDFRISKRSKRFINSCEKEIEMLSFGVIEAIVEHIIELTGMVPTTSSFDHFQPATFKLVHLNSIDSDEEDYLGSLIICLMVLLDLMTLKNYQKLFESRSNHQSKELVLNLFAVYLNALHYFPDNWLEIKMAVNRIILHSLTMLRTIMAQEFLGIEKFDETIWRMYFKLVIAYLIQPRLQLESLPGWKRQFILDIYGGDMRSLMGHELVACWNLIGLFKINFIPNLVGSFVDVTLLPQIELRQATIPIFYDMLMVDYMANSNFKQVEATLIDRLDAIAHKSECDVEFMNLFTGILETKLDQYKPIWFTEGMSLVKSISRMLMLLIDYHWEMKRKMNNFKNVNEVDDRLLTCTYALMEFFNEDSSSTNKKVLMLRYLDKLIERHKILGNHSEVAFALRLKANQLTWSPNEASLKESLCSQMLDFFDKGKCWEEGIRVCKELQDVYERSYKLMKLSSILKRHAELLDKILNETRVESEYFRVSFYGLEFPSFLRNSTFIFRGFEFEKISSFTHRIQQEFPSAQLLTKVIPTNENITESLCQYIQIFSVKPLTELPAFPSQSLIFGSPDHNALDYYTTNSVKQFIQDRPIQRAPFDPNNEFKSLWIERTTYTTEQTLPGMLSMFKVIATQVNYVAPIENACETIENMNVELSKLIANYTEANSKKLESISPLSMRLQGILDAAVNGGIAKYIEAFLSSEFIANSPDQLTNVTRLKERISHQISLLEAGLTLHGRLAPPPVRPLHARLLERFSTMRNTVHQSNIETSQALLWNPQNSFIHRPSILSQPLPPIPPIHPNRPDSLSDPDTSSLSSASSISVSSNQHHQQCSNVQESVRSNIRTPPLPPSVFNYSPASKSLKNKPLPPLPSNEKTLTPLKNQEKMNASQYSTTELCQRSNDDSIYSVPQYTDLDLTSLLAEKESSVDDSMDYCDVLIDTNSKTNSSVGDVLDGKEAGVIIVPRVNRSFSIPRSSMSFYNTGTENEQTRQQQKPIERNSMAQSNQNLFQMVEAIDLEPPPLPPRSSNLDRSNSLNSAVRSLPFAAPPLPPPALPQRMVKNSQCVVQRESVNLSEKIDNKNSPHQRASSKNDDVSMSSYFSDLNGIEFENLVISSPTPRSENTAQTSRPAPIIGIEINNNDEHRQQNALADVVFNGNISNHISQKQIEEHRSKSSSLPRTQQFANLNSFENSVGVETQSQISSAYPPLQNNSSLFN